MNENGYGAFLTFWALMLAYINPYAAIGACFGCVFFLQYPSVLTLKARLGLGAVSWALGYGAGTFWYSAGPPWSPEAFLPALVGAALGPAVVTAMAAIIDKNGEVPPWLDWVAKQLPWRR